MWLVWIHYEDFLPKVNPLHLQLIITMTGLFINTLMKLNILFYLASSLINLLSIYIETYYRWHFMWPFQKYVIGSKLNEFVNKGNRLTSFLAV